MHCGEANFRTLKMHEWFGCMGEEGGGGEGGVSGATDIFYF